MKDILTITESGAWKFVLTEQESDTTGPVPDVIEVGTYGNNVISGTFDETIDDGSVPEPEDFTLTFSGGAVSVSVAQITAGPYLILTLSRVITVGETGSLVYSGTAIKDTWGNSAAGFTETITNNVT